MDAFFTPRTDARISASGLTTIRLERAMQIEFIPHNLDGTFYYHIVVGNSSLGLIAYSEIVEGYYYLPRLCNRRKSARLIPSLEEAKVQAIKHYQILYGE